MVLKSSPPSRCNSILSGHITQSQNAVRDGVLPQLCEAEEVKNDCSAEMNERELPLRLYEIMTVAVHQLFMQYEYGTSHIEGRERRRQRHTRGLTSLGGCLRPLYKRIERVGKGRPLLPFALLRTGSAPTYTEPTPGVG